MNTAEQVTKELERIATEARGSIESVQAEMKSLKEQNQELVRKNEGLAARFQELEQHTLTTATGGQMKAQRKSLGEQFAASDSFQAFVNRESKSATFTSNQTLKNLVNAGAGDTNATEYPTHPQRDPRLGNDPRRRLSLLEALPSLPMESATFEWVSLDGYQNAAAEQQLEGDTKAEAVMPNELKSVRAATIAHFLPASEQVLQDTPQLASQIESLLRYGVQAKAENLIIAGDGIIQGLEEVGTAFTAATGLSLADAISESQASLDATGWNASHVVMHPTDWHAIRSERAAGGNEQYVATGWNMPAAPNIWGLSVVTSPAVQQGRPIVLDASQVAILDRMGAVVEMFREDSTNVRSNTVTIRAEARMAFAVFAPSAVKLVSPV